MRRSTRTFAAAAVGAMAGACAGIELAIRFRQPDTRVLLALFAVSFALMGAVIGAVFQLAIAAPAAETDEADLD